MDTTSPLATLSDLSLPFAPIKKILSSAFGLHRRGLIHRSIGPACPTPPRCPPSPLHAPPCRSPAPRHPLATAAPLPAQPPRGAHQGCAGPGRRVGARPGVLTQMLTPGCSRVSRRCSPRPPSRSSPRGAPVSSMCHC
jgi:hypothetical protein